MTPVLLVRDPERGQSHRQKVMFLTTGSRIHPLAHPRRCGATGQSRGTVRSPSQSYHEHPAPALYLPARAVAVTFALVTEATEPGQAMKQAIWLASISTYLHDLKRPSLWSRIHVDDFNQTGGDHYMKLRLSRAAPSPLHLSISCTPYPALRTPVWERITSAAERIHTITTSFSAGAEGADGASDVVDDVKATNGLTRTCFEALHIITVIGTRYADLDCWNLPNLRTLVPKT